MPSELTIAKLLCEADSLLSLVAHRYAHAGAIIPADVREQMLDCSYRCRNSYKTHPFPDTAEHITGEVVGLLAAPPSAPTGDGMPTLDAGDLTHVRHRISYLNDIRLWDGTPEGEEAVRQKLAELESYRRVLALLDWATRRQEQGNG